MGEFASGYLSKLEERYKDNNFSTDLEQAEAAMHMLETAPTNCNLFNGLYRRYKTLEIQARKNKNEKLSNFNREVALFFLELHNASTTQHHNFCMTIPAEDRES